jgi:hypothetical protein
MRDRFLMARRNEWIAAECLLAYRNGEDSDDAHVGGALIAEGIHMLRLCAKAWGANIP